MVMDNKISGKVRQIGRFFLTNGESERDRVIPLSSGEFYEKCNQMCAVSSNKNERDRRPPGKKGVYFTYACEGSECSLDENQRGSRLDEAITHHANQSWGSRSNGKHCCTDNSCSTKNTPCNGVLRYNKVENCSDKCNV